MTGWDAIRQNGRSLPMLVVAAGLLLVAIVYACVGQAEASQPGVYWEAGTAADGVGVRRLRDSANGVVCYVAKAKEPNSYDGYGSGDIDIVSVGISCVKVTP